MLRFVRRSTKPDKKEFQKIAFATGKNFQKNFSKKKFKIFENNSTFFLAVGFLIMGFIGYFVKLIHIPINNIIVG